MEKLLKKINETFDNCMSNSTDETKLQLRILKNNINTLFTEYMGSVSAATVNAYKDKVDEEVVTPKVEISNEFNLEQTVSETIAYEPSVTAMTTSSIVMEEAPSVAVPEVVEPTIPVIPTPPIIEKDSPVNESVKHNILIVDDSSIVRNYLEKVFSEDYNVFMAVDGKDAIDKIGNDDFIKDISLILLDLMMPNIDGFGVLEYITGRQLSIPVMIISGDNSKETINRAFQYNVVDVIEKPFDAQKIKNKITRFISL